MTLVKVKKIFVDETFTPNAGFTFINCDTIQGTPKEAWLTQDPNSDMYQAIVTENPNDEFAIKGVWIGNNDQLHGVLVDGTLDDFLEKCNSCCGDDTDVTPVYNNVFPSRPDATQKDYTVVREDRGNGQDRETFVFDYMDFIIDGTLQSSHNTGTGETTYTFKSYSDPIAIGADELTETARVFDSNAPGALSGGNNNYSMVVSINGVAQDAVVGTTLANLLTAAVTEFGTTYGTFTNQTTFLRLTTTVVDDADLVITQVTI